MSLVESEMLLSALFRIKRGRIIDVESDGRLQVTSKLASSTVLCEFVRLNSAPRPELKPGDTVLWLQGDSENEGYVFGVVDNPGSSRLQGIEGVVAIGIERVTDVRIVAEARIEMRCGKSSLTMNSDGKIVLKGEELVSRARRVNKIRGASVKIN